MSTVSQLDGACRRLRVPRRFRMPVPSPGTRTAHTAVRGAAAALVRIGCHHDARELLLATVKSALRAWVLAIGYSEPAWNTDVLFYARRLREAGQIDRPTYEAINYLAHGRFDGTTAVRHLETVRQIHDFVFWTTECVEGGAA